MTSRKRPLQVSLPKGAVEYVRMSTEHQQYSIENQQDVIRKFAEQHGTNIVRTYADGAKTGMLFKGRNALQELIRAVESGQPDFDTILVYDVTRWGRYLDPDESAYWEFLCKRKGIRVEYCAEPYLNDNSPAASILKSVKRFESGDYNRGLSTKVFAGQCRLIRLGYRQGGHAGYGLRRMLQDHQGQRKEILLRAQRKSIQMDRVILVPGPPEEVAVVERIYHLFIHERLNEQAIAAVLNQQSILTDLGRPWTRATVHQVLTNPKYQGENVFNRVSFKLKQERVRNPPDMWVRREHAFAPIIDSVVFAQAQAIIFARHQHLTTEDLLARLQNLFKERGMLSAIIINETEGMPSSSIYRSRFKSLVRAYALVGYNPTHDYAYLEINQLLRERHRELNDELVKRIKETGAVVEDKGRSLRVNDLILSTIVSRCSKTKAGSFRWTIRLDLTSMPDLTIATRMQPDNRTPLDYYILPAIDMRLAQLRLKEQNGITMDVYRFDDLSYFYRLISRTKFVEVA
jgi:DNA invertase Pin-like site-specific DNA recombinase